MYWEPLYAWLRRSGFEKVDAEDLTQAFFAHLLEHDAFAQVSPSKGRFRSFLLASLRNFVADQRDRATAAKRGRGLPGIPLEGESAERRYLTHAAVAQTPDAVFDRHWALLMLHRALLTLKQEFHNAGKDDHFNELSVFLATEGSAQDYATAAKKLNMKLSSVAVAVHRLRFRYRDTINAEIAQTVSSPLEARQEMSYLLEVLSQSAFDTPLPDIQTL
jgi:DNA-directed RNA polymerase specialized sigma24 family protein